MKQAMFILIMSFFFHTASAQNFVLPDVNKLEKTTSVPKGITLKKDGISVSKGYSATVSSDGKIAVIKKANNSAGGAISVTCACKILFNSPCAVIISGGKIECATCYETKPCSVLIGTSVTTNTIRPSITQDESGKQTEWKILDIGKDKL